MSSAFWKDILTGVYISGQGDGCGDLSLVVPVRIGDGDETCDGEDGEGLHFDENECVLNESILVKMRILSV